MVFSSTPRGFHENLYLRALSLNSGAGKPGKGAKISRIRISVDNITHNSIHIYVSYRNIENYLHSKKQMNQFFRHGSVCREYIPERAGGQYRGPSQPRLETSPQHP